MKLYEIAEQFRNLAEIADCEEFAQNEDVLNALDSVETAFEEKAVNVVYAIKNLESEENALEEEIKRLTARKKAREGRVKNLKEYLKRNMASTGKTDIDTPLFKISLGAPRAGAVQYANDFDLAKLPIDFQKMEIKPDTAKIKEALQNGLEFSGVSLAETRSLTIR